MLTEFLSNHLPMTRTSSSMLEFIFAWLAIGRRYPWAICMSSFPALSFFNFLTCPQILSIAVLPWTGRLSGEQRGAFNALQGLSGCPVHCSQNLSRVFGCLSVPVLLCHHEVKVAVSIGNDRVTLVSYFHSVRVCQNVNPEALVVFSFGHSNCSTRLSHRHLWL